MRKLLNTLFVTTPDTYLSLDNDSVTVIQDEKTLIRVPLLDLELIFYFGYKGASPALMGYCASHGIRLTFLSQSVRFLAAVAGENKGNVLLRKEQYRRADDEQKSVLIARNFITGKVYNARWVLERAVRDHGMRINAEKVKAASTALYEMLSRIRDCDDFGTLRGLEGKAAELYYSVFDELILSHKDLFCFKNRSRRPPLDRVNALLSFAYTILGNECSSALESVGLDPYVGFMHTDRPGRASLSLDILEELRSIYADRFVLSLINKEMIKSNSFIEKENGAVLLSDDGKRVFLNAWQKKKQEIIKHPFLSENIEWGLVPYVQALLLARHLRNDIGEYPTFLWK